ncbi:MAG: XdhC family protein [Microvirga sp.]
MDRTIEPAPPSGSAEPLAEAWTGAPAEIRAGTPAAAVAATALQVLRFLAAANDRGRRVALVSITALTGSSSRPVGTLMGVADDGSFAGSFSGGCIEAAVVAEAREAIRDGKVRQVRYGAGSPYLDIRLPCGGGVDLLFQPDPDSEAIRHAVALLEDRTPLTLVQAAGGGLRAHSGPVSEETGWRGDEFIAWYPPPLKLVILGHGGESLSMVRLGLTFGAEVEMLSPDERMVALARELGARGKALAVPGPSPDLVTDRWSAVVFLFHDHAWEPLLLQQALAQPAFFIGAMGSRRTHAGRLDALRDIGVSEESLARIVSPLGIIPSARDPVTLALSALTQVVDGYRRISEPPKEPARDRHAGAI